MPAMKRWVLLLMGVVAAGAVAADEAPAESAVLRYLRETLLIKEFGEGNGRVLRWKEAPEVVLAEGGDKELLRGVVDELNTALKGSDIQLTLVEVPKTERRIRVHLVPEARFQEIGRDRGFEVPGNLDGYVHVRWNTAGRFILEATVMIATDKVDGAMRRHTLLEELTQSLGPLGDTTVTPDSVLFSRDGDHGKAPVLGELDRRMLRLLYRHLEPGDGGLEVGVAYARHWGE